MGTKRSGYASPSVKREWQGRKTDDWKADSRNTNYKKAALTEGKAVQDR
ncbi:hypothetical protein VVDAL7940_03788 [Vibrio vulnificus]|nr:hypothetical protein VVDAL7940_03788 [Vibrio vulnificus]